MLMRHQKILTSGMNFSQAMRTAKRAGFTRKEVTYVYSREQLQGCDSAILLVDGLGSESFWKDTDYEYLLHLETAGRLTRIIIPSFLTYATHA